MDYTKRVIEALQQCDGIEDYKLIIGLEPLSKDIVEYAYSLSAVFNQVEILHRPYIYGCGTNILHTLAVGFEQSDYVVNLEDDVVPHRDILKYFEWGADTYRDDKDIFTISGYNNPSDDFDKTVEPRSQQKLTLEDYPPHIVNRQCNFTPWGWATWKDRFDEMKTNWNPNSWDVHLQHNVVGERYEIYPLLSRTLNIGKEMGTHVSPHVQERSHYNPFWAGAYDNIYESEFEENIQAKKIGGIRGL